MQDSLKEDISRLQLGDGSKNQESVPNECGPINQIPGDAMTTTIPKDADIQPHVQVQQSQTETSMQLTNTTNLDTSQPPPPQQQQQSIPTTETNDSTIETTLSAVLDKTAEIAEQVSDNSINPPQIESSDPSFETLPATSQEYQTQSQIVKNNGIFQFMTPDRAAELYKKIHAQGTLDLEWKFYGRRKPGEPENDTTVGNSDDHNTSKDINQPNDTVNTEFDFDDDFGDVDKDTSAANDSLMLKKRPEIGSEKKTNFSDIMNDIRKESHSENPP